MVQDTGKLTVRSFVIPEGGSGRTQLQNSRDGIQMQTVGSSEPKPAPQGVESPQLRGCTVYVATCLPKWVHHLETLPPTTHTLCEAIGMVTGR